MSQPPDGATPGPASEPPTDGASDTGEMAPSGPPTGYETPGYLGFGWGDDEPDAAQAPAYPKQELTEQVVDRRRHRTALIALAVALAVVIAAGIVAWQLVSRGGQDTRAAYCTALRQAQQSGDVLGLRSASATPLRELNRLRRLAPASVRPSWDEIYKTLANTSPGNPPDLASLVPLLNDVVVIVKDARSNCGMKIPLPTLGG